MNEIYHEYAITQLKKIGAKINGNIRFEIYPDNDMVMFRTEFKGFTYNHVFGNIQDRMYSGNDDAVNEFLKGYKEALMRCFFKSEEKKKWEKKREFKPRRGSRHHVRRMPYWAKAPYQQDEFNDKEMS